MPHCPPPMLPSNALLKSAFCQAWSLANPLLVRLSASFAWNLTCRVGEPDLLACLHRRLSPKKSSWMLFWTFTAYCLFVTCFFSAQAFPKISIKSYYHIVDEDLGSSLNQILRSIWWFATEPEFELIFCSEPGLTDWSGMWRQRKWGGLQSECYQGATVGQPSHMH